MEQIGFSLLMYGAAYMTTTIVGILHTLFNIMVLKMKPMDANSMGEGYEKTKPFHPLYNILIFPLFAYLYLQGINSVTLEGVILTSVVWGTITIVIDTIGWVAIKHPWSLTAKEFFIDYQPWITFIYLIIYASPFIAYWLLP